MAKAPRYWFLPPYEIRRLVISASQLHSLRRSSGQPFPFLRAAASYDRTVRHAKARPVSTHMQGNAAAAVRASIISSTTRVQCALLRVQCATSTSASVIYPLPAFMTVCVAV
jgi:hypothetical protein